ncbi:hypothetical protein EGW08_013614 [Elysia chlorotica]|uniref:RIIa domain-containing protein n=1 Tax=Elysia chlorotica TaxID=188477 RepID=A0A433TB15_ELYCH|nr:hypothetical protein EGW08_013614 [Elysia chlorotica]
MAPGSEVQQTLPEASPYLLDNIGLLITKCLTDVVQARPADPIDFMAHWLYHYAGTQQYLAEKAQQARAVEILAEEERAHAHSRWRRVLNTKSKINKYEHLLRINRPAPRVVSSSYSMPADFMEYAFRRSDSSSMYGDLMMDRFGPGSTTEMLPVSLRGSLPSMGTKSTDTFDAVIPPWIDPAGFSSHMLPYQTFELEPPVSEVHRTQQAGGGKSVPFARISMVKRRPDAEIIPDKRTLGLGNRMSGQVAEDGPDAAAPAEPTPAQGMTKSWKGRKELIGNI